MLYFLNILVTLNTAIYDKGILIKDRKLILAEYKKHSYKADLTAIVFYALYFIFKNPYFLIS